MSSTSLETLAAALGDRYAVEREIDVGGMRPSTSPMIGSRGERSPSRSCVRISSPRSAPTGSSERFASPRLNRGRRHRATHRHGAHDRDAGVCEPRAGHGRPRARGAERHLLVRLRALRVTCRRASVHRCQRAGRHHEAIHRHGTVGPAFAGTVPLAVDRAIAKALERTPADRFSSATMFAEALLRPDAPAPRPAFAV